jgi:hypothetical protein
MENINLTVNVNLGHMDDLARRFMIENPAGPALLRCTAVSEQFREMIRAENIVVYRNYGDKLRSCQGVKEER